MATEPDPDFSQPWKVSDVVLLVEDARLHVHSGVLAMWSPVLENMFTELKRKNSRVLTLENQKCEEIRELLLFIYPTVQKPVTEGNCYFLLELAEQFQMPKVTEKCEEYLLKTMAESSSEIVDLLVLAAKYQMATLREECLQKVKQLEWRDLERHNLYEQIDLKDYREIAEQKIHSVQQELNAANKKISLLEEDAVLFSRQRDVSNAPSTTVVNAGLASPIFPRKQIVQPRPQRSNPVKVSFHSSVKATQTNNKIPTVPVKATPAKNVPSTVPDTLSPAREHPPPIPKRTHYYPIKPIIKEF